MALRLAGEEFSVVRGLDALGWPREVEANDANPGLKITQGGSGPALQVVSGDIALGSNKLKTTNLKLVEVESVTFGIEAADSATRRGLILQDLEVVGIIRTNVGSELRAPSADGSALSLHAKDSGVSLAEVARLQGAADPYFQATLPMVLKPSSQPGTPVEGHFWYDSTAKKLKFYNGTAVETVTSA